MRLGWFFGAPDRIPTNDPCPKLSRATRRKCFDGLITEILTQLLGEIDKDRHVDEETFDFLPLPAWGRVKINFYSAYLKTQGDPMPSSTFKELEEGELEKYSVPRPNILKDDFTGLNGFGGWSGFLGSFASTVTAMTASDPSNKSLRTVRVSDTPEESKQVWVRLLEKGAPRFAGLSKANYTKKTWQTWRTTFFFVDSSKSIRGAIIRGSVLSKKIDSKGDYPHLYQCELVALLICLSQQEHNLRDQDAPANLSAFVISGGEALRIVEAQLISPTEIRFIHHHESDIGSTQKEICKAALWALSTPIE